MKNNGTMRTRTRRQFLADAIKAGIGVAAVAVLGPQAVTASPLEQGRRPERVEVLVEDIVEASATAFARGRARGVAVVEAAGRAALRGSVAGGEFVSGTITLRFPATHLGLHWVLGEGAPEEVTVSVRSSADRQRWSEWYPLSIEALGKESDSREVFAALAPASRNRFVQYRLAFSAETATVEQVTVTSLNSVDGPREPLAVTALDLTTYTVTDATTGLSLNVVTREGWGCDETLNVTRRGVEKWPEMYVPAKKVVIHHTATSNTYTDGAAQVRSIYTYHARTLGWGDIGYNLLLDHYGTIYEGRHGRGNVKLTDDPNGRQVLSADVVAGHDLYHNYGSVGISVLGDFSVLAYDTWAEMDAAWPNLGGQLVAATAFECGRHFIDPRGASDFLCSNDVWSSTLFPGPMKNISGHKDTNNTACPGSGLYQYLDSLRSTVAARLAEAGSAEAPDLHGEQVGDTLAFSWSSGYSEHEYCLEGWRRLPDSEDIEYLTEGDGFYKPSGYNDPLAKEMVWKTINQTTFMYNLKATGHYTLHVRGAGAACAANVTLLVTETGATLPDGTMHVGDLDGSIKVKGPSWTAKVTAIVHDTNHAAVPNASVSGTWSGAYSGTALATTDSNGKVSFTTGNIVGTSGQVTFAITGVEADGYTYDSSSNHDPDGDSDAATITVAR